MWGEEGNFIIIFCLRFGYIFKYITMILLIKLIKFLMNKIKFISKTKEFWEKEGKFDTSFLEVSKQDNEILLEIEARDEIKELKSMCFILSEKDAKRFREWLMDLDFMPLEE